MRVVPVLKFSMVAPVSWENNTRGNALSKLGRDPRRCHLSNIHDKNLTQRHDTPHRCINGSLQVMSLARMNNYGAQNPHYYKETHWTTGRRM